MRLIRIFVFKCGALTFNVPAESLWSAHIWLKDNGFNPDECKFLTVKQYIEE